MYKISEMQEKLVKENEERKKFYKDGWIKTRNSELGNIAFSVLAIAVVGSLIGRMVVPGFLTELPDSFFPPISSLKGTDKLVEGFLAFSLAVPTLYLVYLIKRSVSTMKESYDNYKNVGKKK